MVPPLTQLQKMLSNSWLPPRNCFLPFAIQSGVYLNWKPCDLRAHSQTCQALTIKISMIWLRTKI